MEICMHLAQNPALFVENGWWQCYLTKEYGNICLQLTLHSIVLGLVPKLTCSGEPGETTWSRSSNGLRAQRGLTRPLSGSNWLSKGIRDNLIPSNFCRVKSKIKLQSHRTLQLNQLFWPRPSGSCCPVGTGVEMEESLRFLANSSVDFVFSLLSSASVDTSGGLPFVAYNVPPPPEV